MARDSSTKLSYVDEDEPIIQTHFPFEPGKTYHITVITENEIMIVYVDDTKVLSNRVFSSIDGANLCLFAKHANATIKTISIKED